MFMFIFAGNLSVKHRVRSENSEQFLQRLVFGVEDKGLSIISVKLGKNNFHNFSGEAPTNSPKGNQSDFFILFCYFHRIGLILYFVEQ